MTGLNLSRDDIVIPASRLVDAFAEWDRRFRAEPDRYESQAVHLLSGDPTSYGLAAGTHFLELLQEVGPSSRYAPGLVEKLQALVDSYGMTGVKSVLNDQDAIRL